MDFDHLARASWELITTAKRVLLSCHPRADFDSVGSVLAMGEVLEQVGKEVTMIAGDTPLPGFAKFFPGAEKIKPQNFFQINPADFDLFVVLDASAPNRVSELGEVKFPGSWRVIVIDHHATNQAFGEVSVVQTAAAATAQVLFELFSRWPITLTRDIALNLLLALYGDTNSYRYPSTTPRTLAIASDLLKLVPDYATVLDELDNNETFGRLRFRALGVNRAERFFGDQIIITTLSQADLQACNISAEEANGSGLSGLLRSVAGCQVAVVLTEEVGGRIKVSSRSRNAERFDVSRLAAALGGGGHRMAAGATILDQTLDEVKERILNWCQANFTLDKQE